MQRRAVALALFLVLTGVATPAAAQDARPEAIPDGPPNPADCTVEPRNVTLQDWLELATATTTPSMFDSMVTYIELDEAPPQPAGPAPDPEIVAEIEWTVYLLAACHNADNFAQTTSLATDDYWIRLIPQVAERDGVTPLEVAASITILTTAPTENPPTPDPEVVGITVEEPRLLEDGRVSALITHQYAEIDPYGGLFVFIEDDGQWLLDDRLLINLPKITPTSE